MSDMSTVIVGVVSILSCVSLVTWLARPAEFRPVRVPRSERPPKPARVPRASRPPQPVSPPPVSPALAQLAAQQAAFSASALPSNALPELSLPERLAAAPSPKRVRAQRARSYLYVTKVPTRR